MFYIPAPGQISRGGRLQARWTASVEAATSALKKKDKIQKYKLRPNGCQWFETSNCLEKVSPWRAAWTGTSCSHSVHLQFSSSCVYILVVALEQSRVLAIFCITVFTSDHPCIESKQCTLNTWVVWNSLKWKLRYKKSRILASARMPPLIAARPRGGWASFQLTTQRGSL